MKNDFVVSEPSDEKKIPHPGDNTYQSFEQEKHCILHATEA